MKEFNLEFHSNQEWTSDPDRVVVTIHDAWDKRIEAAAAALKKAGGDMMEFWWAAGYEFLLDEGDGTFVVFEPEYRVSGCYVRVYGDGTFLFKFPFKHTDEEGWTDSLRWEDGVAI